MARTQKPLPSGNKRKLISSIGKEKVITITIVFRSWKEEENMAMHFFLKKLKPASHKGGTNSFKRPPTLRLQDKTSILDRN